MKTSKDILQEEVDILIQDIIEAYENSGKKVTGEFAEGLESRVSGNKIELIGYAYLAGRPAGQMPPVDEIEKWVVAKGIASLGTESSGIAWAVAKKIKSEGTADSSSLPIYEEVLTSERMDSIIDKVSEFHVQQFVQEVTTRIMLISQKYIK